MRVRGLLTVSALIVGTVATVGSSTVGAEADNSSVVMSAVTSSAHVAGEAVPQAKPLPSAGIVAAPPRIARSQRSAPTTPAPPAAPLAPPGSTAPADISGLIAAPVILNALGIPEIVLNAYRGAELQMMIEQPGCGLPWHLLAGIGRIESGHARGGNTGSLGTTVTPILGPVLDGSLSGNEVITDTDGGRVDGDPTHDRAVGPMQFIPSTWASYASDGNADGIADPNNVFDAALAAARYLCAGNLDLREPAQEMRAVLRYNNSGKYAADVLNWSNAYKNGGTPAPDRLPGAAPTPTPELLGAPSGEGGAPDSLDTPTPGTPAPIVPPHPAPPAPGTPPPPALGGPPALPGLPELPPLPCVLFCAPPPPPVNETATSDTLPTEGDLPTPVG
ncbi:MAG: lytic transglycosylase [Rhodococcus sp.]|nr:lytic transglycosylase [Rhodococcus sp. (in: high G+C Gram-positive bacteria)]